MAKRKKHRGHYCWACDRVHANERFSGGGHSKHICRDCQKLGADELAYRQGIRNIERCLNFCGGIRRNKRKEFERFLDHKNPRIEGYAERVKRDFEVEREAWCEVARYSV